MARKKSYQHGTVELHNGQWSVRYREFDHLKQQWNPRREMLGGFKNKAAARRAADPIMARVNERNNVIDPTQLHASVTFKAFIAGQWKEYCIKRGHQPSTVYCYDCLIRAYMMPFFGEKRMQSITPADITAFLAKCRETVSQNSLLKIYMMLNLMFEIARQYDFVPQSPVRPMVHRPESEKIEKTTLTPEQIRLVLSHLRPDDRLFNLLLGVTGLRVGECFALRWMDLDEGKRELTIAHTLYRGKLKEPKTKTSKGKLRLHPAVVELLVAHRAKSAFASASDFIFCNPDGSPLHHQIVRCRLQKAMEEAGIERVKGHHGFHIYRHSAATLLFKELDDMKPVQELLRHADGAVTEGYVHSDRQIVAGAGELLVKVIFGDSEPNLDLFVTQESKMVS